MSCLLLGGPQTYSVVPMLEVTSGKDERTVAREVIIGLPKENVQQPITICVPLNVNSLAYSLS